MEFLKKYNNPKNFRFDSFEFALIEAQKRNHKTLVETGVARGKKKFFFFSKINWKDGMSTLILSDYARHVNGNLTSCDISKKNIDNAKKFTKANKEFITFVSEDSLNFLTNFNKNIDFLSNSNKEGEDTSLLSSMFASNFNTEIETRKNVSKRFFYQSINIKVRLVNIKSCF